MGWTSYNATYYKNGKVDRKAEIDAMWNNDSSHRYEVLKSRMVGSTYYGAIKVTPENEDPFVFAAVWLTSTNMKDYYNFAYKDMDESVGPYYYDCPANILKLLSPTESERANEWRSKCWEKINKKKDPNSLNKLPVGSVIRFTFYGDGWSSGNKDGDTVLLKKGLSWRRGTKWFGGGYCYPPKFLEGHYEVVWREPKEFTFGELVNKRIALDGAWFSDESRAVDAARGLVHDCFAQLGTDLDDAEYPEDVVEAFYNDNELLLDKKGNLIGVTCEEAEKKFRQWAKDNTEYLQKVGLEVEIPEDQDYLDYNGQKFPIEYVEVGMIHALVAPLSIRDHLVKDGEFVSGEAKIIDSQIYYYVPDDVFYRHMSERYLKEKYGVTA